MASPARVLVELPSEPDFTEFADVGGFGNPPNDGVELLGHMQAAFIRGTVNAAHQQRASRQQGQAKTSTEGFVCQR